MQERIHQCPQQLAINRCPLTSTINFSCNFFNHNIDSSTCPNIDHSNNIHNLNILIASNSPTTSFFDCRGWEEWEEGLVIGTNGLRSRSIKYMYGEYGTTWRRT